MRCSAFSVACVSVAVLSSGCLLQEKMRSLPRVQNLHYVGNSGELAELETPKGFEISPQEAMRIFNAARGPRKTILDIYRGPDRYFLIDGFFDSEPGDAALYGTIIDGRTGQVFDSETQTWFSVFPYRDPALAETDAPPLPTDKN